jgi:nucleotide-binding universal stress UspA family protein
VEKLTQILAVVEGIEDGQRVLEKAVALARHFDARVELLVADSKQMRTFSELCLERSYTEVFLSSAHRGSDALHDVIQRRVDFGHPDIVVKSPAPRHGDDAGLAAADWLLASQCQVPILLVRQHAWADPVRIAISLDVSDPDRERTSRALMHTAGFLALGCRGNLDLLYSERELEDEAVRMQRAVRVAQLVREFHVGCERLQMFEGEPGDQLPPLIAARQYDVVVIGTEAATHGWMTPHLATSHELAAATAGDIVLVHAATDADARIAAWKVSSRGHEQLDESK